MFRKSTYIRKTFYEVLKIKFLEDALPRWKTTGILETDAVHSEAEGGSRAADGPDSTRSSRSASSSGRATAGTEPIARIHTMPLRA